MYDLGWAKHIRVANERTSSGWLVENYCTEGVGMDEMSVGTCSDSCTNDSPNYLQTPNEIHYREQSFHLTPASMYSVPWQS
jgi:hypothetical protein